MQLAGIKPRTFSHGDFPVTGFCFLRTVVDERLPDPLRDSDDARLPSLENFNNFIPTKCRPLNLFYQPRPNSCAYFNTKT